MLNVLKVYGETIHDKMNHRSQEPSTEYFGDDSDVYDESDSSPRRYATQRTMQLTADIARDLIAFTLGRSSWKTPTKHMEAMRRVVGELKSRHEILFNGMMAQLSISHQNRTELKHMFGKIADEIFADNVYNWGRISTLFAFAATIAKYVVDNGISNGVRYEHIITEVLINYINSSPALWIDRQGGWVSPLR